MASPTSTTTFKADISQLKAAMQQAQRSVKLAASEFKAATAGMDDWTQSAEGLQAKLKQLKTTLSAQKQQLGLLEEQLEKTEKEYGKNSAAADRVRMSLNNQKAAIAKTEKEIEQYDEELAKAEKYGDNFADSLDEIDDASAKASDGFTVMKGALASLVADGIRLAIDAAKEFITSTIEVGKTFEKSMSSVQALSGATKEEMQLLSDTAKEFGATTQFSASEAADALSYMALAGWDAQTSASALGGVLDLAAASSMELASASDMVTDYMSAFNIEAENSAQFADILAYAQANANTTVEGLGEAFRNSAANMNAAGQDIETTTSLLAMMANQGLKGSEAGTALTAMMRDLTKKMSEGKITIGETEVAVQDASGNFRDMTEILKDVNKAVDGMGDAEKSSALMTTFTADSIKGLNLVLNAGIENASDFEDQLRNCSGTAGEMAKQINDNLYGDLTALNSKFEATKIEVYESLTPALRDAVGEIIGVIDSINWDEVGSKLGDLTREAVEFGKDIIDNAEGIIDVVKAVGSVLAVTFVVTKVLSFAQAIFSLYQTFKTLKTATDAATTSQLLLNAAEAATPIGLVVAAVAGLTAGVVYLASKNDEATESTKRFTEAQQEQIDKINDLRDSYKELKATRDESVKSINAEFGYYEKLAKELDGIVDENGKVQAGYEDRANFIVTTLNDAVGTEMQLIDGVIQNYEKERETINDLINTKKAEAVLRANEEAYTNAIQNQNEALNQYLETQDLLKTKREEANKIEQESIKLAEMGVDKFAEQVGLTEDIGYATELYKRKQEELAESFKQAQFAVGEANTAYRTAENTYIEYEATIKNYEGLSAAIISGDQKKIKDALMNQNNDFKTAESATKKTLEAQVKDMEENYNLMKKAVDEGAVGVTKEMVDETETMVKKAKAELEKLPDETGKIGKQAGKNYSDGLSSEKSDVKKSSESVKKTASDGMKNDESFKKSGQQSGKEYASGIGETKSDANAQSKSVAQNAKSGFDSVDTTQSGKNFGQGFVNGIGSTMSSAFNKAYQLAQKAVEGVKKGQKEGSPSKITYQSGIYFVQGYINGIVSQNGKLQQTIKDMVSTAVSELSNMSNFNFDTVAENAGAAFDSALSKKFDYTLNRMQYENEQKLAEFDSKIETLTSKQEAETTRLQSASDEKISAIETQRDKKVKEIEKQRDKKVSDLQKQLDKIGTGKTKEEKKKNSEKKKNLQNLIKQTKNEASAQIKSIKESATAQINAQKQANEQLQKSAKETATTLINEQKEAKEAYSKASSEMISEYQSAMNEYQSKAQKLIDDTLNGITERYNQRYDELIDKQNNLITKLKEAGSLFNISGAGVMTINDLQEQTRQIREYTSKLQRIKQKVSSELFDEIANFDMKEGSAYMDRLLSMSESELDAYNNAYTEKMQAALEAGESIYKADINKIASDYDTEIKQAFEDLPAELEQMGIDAMKGFIDGLTENTDYMSESIKTYISAMVDTFKTELSQMASQVSTPLNLTSSISGVRSAISGQNGLGASSYSTVNNYNLVQNNTSPKSLTALETYQARRQQVAMVKALTS